MNLRHLGLATALFGLLGLPLHAQEVPFGEDTHAFRRLLLDLGFSKGLSTFEDVRKDPAHTLIIVLGDVTPLNRVDDLAVFVDAGGGLLVATDRRVDRGPLASSFGVRIDGRKVTAPEDRAYRGLRDCPLVNCNVASALPGGTGVLAAGVRAELRVATNLPSTLRASRPMRVEAEFATGLGFFGWGSFGAGRVAVLSDHSIFINSMMLQPDNQNLLFAHTLLLRLTGPPNVSQVLFLQDGKVQSDFNIPLRRLPPPPIPSPDDFVPAINDKLAALQREDAFHDAVSEVVPAEPLLRVLAVVASLVLIAYGWYRVCASRHHPHHPAPGALLRRLPGGKWLVERIWPTEPTVPLLAAAVHRPTLRKAVVEQRQAELLRLGNLWEPARALARELFPAREGPPRVMSPLWRDWGLRRRVARWWRLARDETPRPVAEREFRRLASEFEEVRAALAAGRITHGGVRA